MSFKTFTLNDIEPVALGAGVWGTGDDGNPYLNGLDLREMIRYIELARIIDPLDLPDDAIVLLHGYIGTPTADIEKSEEGTELLKALQHRKQTSARSSLPSILPRFGRVKVFALQVASILADLPNVDCNSRGRALTKLSVLDLITIAMERSLLKYCVMACVWRCWACPAAPRLKTMRALDRGAIHFWV